MQIRSKGPGAWQLVWVVGKLPNGRPQERTMMFHGTRAQAEAKWRALQAEMDRGRMPVAATMTFGDLARRWFGDVASQTVRETTLKSYEYLLRVHLIPDLGHLRLRDISAPQLQRYLVQKLSDGSRHDGRTGGLSARTVRYLHAIVSEVLQQAVEWDLMPQNPARRVRPVRMGRRETAVWTEEEAARFMSAAARTPLYALYALAMTTGMRRGELLGLSWQDIDLTGGTLTVRRTVIDTMNGRAFGEPKSATSRRTLDLGDGVVAILKAHKARQNRLRLRQGERYQDLGLVFATRYGTPIEGRNLYRDFQRLCDAAGVPRIRFHDLRHTFATLLMSSGRNPKVVQEMLGHHAASFTMQQYGHLIPGEKREAARAMEERILPGAGEEKL